MLVLVASLVVYTVGSFVALRMAVESTVDRQLAVRVQNIKQFLSENRSHAPSDTSPLIPAKVAGAPDDQLYRVFDNSGKILYESAAMRDWEIPLGTGSLHSHYRHRQDNGTFATYYRRARDVRVLAEKITQGPAELTVQVASIVTPLDDMLSDLTTWIWVGVPSVLVMAGIGGYWLSGRVLKPIREVVVAANRISEHNLQQRLPLGRVRDELWDLTGTLNSMLDRLEAAFSRVTRFTSDASHELRTPVAVIRTISEVALEQERSAGAYKTSLQQILEEAEGTTALIEQLLTLARADANTSAIEFQSVDLREIVEELNHVGEHLAATKSLMWIPQICDDSAIVLGDRSYIRRLFLILIENACRYTNIGGSVRFSLMVAPTALTVQVSDTGIGIPPGEIGKVQERFYRASNARYFAPEGTGLGLSIAHWIATVHQANFDLQSKLGQGTTASVSFSPLASPKEPQLST
jgi:signal transduction histidine kinase